MYICAALRIRPGPGLPLHWNLTPNYAQASLGETTRPVTSWLDAVPGHACWSAYCLPADYGEILFIAANRQGTQHQRMVQGSGCARGTVAHHGCMHASCKRTLIAADAQVSRSVAGSWRSRARFRHRYLLSAGTSSPSPLRGALCPCLGVLSSFEGLTGHESF
jgi:hypothetical protein